MNNNYTYEQKEKLARRINKIKNKSKLIDVLKIIQKDSSYDGMTENNNGIFMLFHNLSNDTYYKIEKYLKKNFNNASDEQFTDSQSTNNIENSYMNDFDLDNQSKFKYSNKEKCIIKRKLYNNALDNLVNNNDNNDINYNDD
jgi:hypothetical protein